MGGKAQRIRENVLALLVSDDVRKAELAKMLKKRLTKKEREVMNDLVNSVDKAVTMESLKADKERYDAILAGAIKKLKNESVHGDFFYSSGASE